MLVEGDRLSNKANVSDHFTAYIQQSDLKYEGVARWALLCEVLQKNLSRNRYFHMFDRSFTLSEKHDMKHTFV